MKKRVIQKTISRSITDVIDKEIYVITFKGVEITIENLEVAELIQRAIDSGELDIRFDNFKITNQYWFKIPIKSTIKEKDHYIDFLVKYIRSFAGYTAASWLYPEDVKEGGEYLAKIVNNKYDFDGDESYSTALWVKPVEIVYNDILTSANTIGKKVFTLEQVLDILTSMDIAINPRLYRDSQNLDTVDFLDLAVCKAQQYGIHKEFDEYQKNDTNLIENGISSKN